MKAKAVSSSMKTWLVTGGLLLTLAGASVGLLVLLERERPPNARASELSYLPKGEYLKVAVLGYRQLAADLIWLKAVQHLGTKYQTKEGYRWAYHAVDVLTDLDPQFVPAYLSAGTVLGVWAGLLDESIAVLKKGMRHNPDVWRFPFVIGYDYFYELCEPALAAKYFQIASTLPGAPAYLPRLAARLSVEAGDPDAAIEFLARFSQQVKDEAMREALAQRMKEVMAERDIRFLEKAVSLYRSRYGTMPATLADLVKRGIIRRIPPEPLGGAYELRMADGTVISTGLRERLHVYRKKRCRVGETTPLT